MADSRATMISVEGECGEHMMGKSFEDKFHCEETLRTSTTHWYAPYSEYLSKGIVPPAMSYEERKTFFTQIKSYKWEDPFLYRECADRIIRRCAMEHQMSTILEYCHTLQSDEHWHHGGFRTASRVLQSGYWWPTLYEDAREFVRNCATCVKMENLTGRKLKALNWERDLEVYDVWEISMIGPFENSENHYILIAVDHVSEWAEILAVPDRDPLRVVRFIHKRILRRLGTPLLLISDSSMDFCAREMTDLLAVYGSRHHVYSPHYTYADGRDIEANHELKELLRMTVKKTGADWSWRIYETLWAYKTSYLTPMGASPFRLVYGYSCYLPADIKQLSYWTMKTLNEDCTEEWEPISLYFRESEEWKSGTKAKEQIYEEFIEQGMTKWLKKDDYKPGQLVLLYHTRLTVFPGELSAGWSGPYMITRVHYFGAVEIEKDGKILKVQKQRVLPYSEESLEVLQSHTRTRYFR